MTITLTPSATDPSGQISIDARVAIRGLAWKYPCRAATTANITISTALNNGDTIDGVTLATGDHVLVKNQSTGSQNGIYIVGATPVRAYDMDQDATTAVPAQEVPGAFVYVIAGTVNAGTLWYVTNTSAVVLGTDAITWAQWTAGDPNAELNIEGGQSVIKAHGSMGSTETFDPTDGNVHTGTLDADCTVTLNAPSGSGAATLEAWITQDGTGGHSITWAAAGGGSVTYDGGVTPTPDTTAGVTVRYMLERIPGTSNDWVVDLVGGTGTDTTMDVPVMVEDGSSGLWYVLVTGDGDAVMTEVPR